MKSLHASSTPSRITIMSQGNDASPPAEFAGTTGILVRRTHPAVLEYWNGTEWKRVNRAGWAAHFCEQMPEIAQGSWAVIHSLPLEVNAGELYLEFTPITLSWALHLIDHPHPRTPASYAYANPESEWHADVADYLTEIKSA